MKKINQTKSNTASKIEFLKLNLEEMTNIKGGVDDGIIIDADMS